MATTGNRMRVTRSTKAVILLFFSLILSAHAYAAGYLDMMRELDLRLLCVVVWFAPPIVVLLFALGGIMFSTGSPENRVFGKAMLTNAVLGFFLVAGFLLISMILVPSLDVASCLTGSASVSQDSSSRGGGIIINAEGYYKKNARTSI